MNTLIFILMALNIAVPLWVIQRFCVTRNGVEFNHILMFSLGFLFYWMVPIVVGMNRLFESELAMRLWYQVFDVISPEAIAIYLGIALCCYLSFVAGTVFTTRLFRTQTCYKEIFFYPRLLDIMLLLALIVAGIYGFLLRDELFHGYTAWSAGEGTEKRGPFIAASVFLLALTFVYMAKKHEATGFTIGFGRLLANRYFLSYIAVAILVLSLGGRLYFVSSLVMLLVYRSVYFSRISTKAALISLGSVAGLSGLVGLFRLGGDVNFQSGLLNVFIEPLFTGFSLIHFLGDATFEWVKFPVFLLSSFINLAPTALLPGKADYIIAPEDYGYVAFAPGGALNSYFSFMINFGILGTMVFFFLFSGFLNYLKLQDRRLLFRVIYVMLCGWLGFTFFRDAFFISIVKTMFQFSVLTPIALVLTAQLISSGIRNFSSQTSAAPKESLLNMPRE